MRNRMSSTAVRTASLFAALSIAGPAIAAGQSQGFEGFQRETARALREKRIAEASGSKSSQSAATEYHFSSKGDSLDWLRGRNLAGRSSGFRVIVSLQDRHVWVVSDE